jgi:tetratricopeptide (TPR) repeat protein
VSARRYVDAIPLLESELADHPENDAARLLLARVLSWQRRYVESLVQYGRLLETKPGDAGLRADRARVLAWSGRHEEAIREYRVASAADPTNVETKIGLARALAWSGDLAGASIMYERLLKQNPALGDAWLGLAAVARWRGAPTASDRFLEKAARTGADPEGVADERAATRDALLPSIGGGWTAARERQYVAGPDFTLETEGPFAQARATIGRAAQLSARVAWLTLTETPAVGDSSNYDLESVDYRTDVSLLRGYPWQAAFGAEYQTFEPRGGAALFPLTGDDTFFGWNGRLWRYTGRFTPRVGAGREYVAIKETQPSGLREFKPGRFDNYEAGLAWQWNGRGTADWAASRGFYSDDNRTWMATGGVTYRIKTRVPTVALDGRVTYRDWDFPSQSYFTPLESVRGAAGITLGGYLERSAVDYSLRYEFSGMNSSNFSDIWTHAWSGVLNLTAFDVLPLGIEGAYSVDNHSYETWFLGLSASARW